MLDDRVKASSLRLSGDGNAILEARSPHQSHIVSVAGGPAFFISGVTLRGAAGGAGFHSNQRARGRSYYAFLIVLTRSRPSRGAPSLRTLEAPDMFDAGAAINVSSGWVSVENCTIEENRSGGIHVSGGALVAENSRILRNNATNGGGVHVSGGSATLSRCLLEANRAEVEGGGLYASGGVGLLLTGTSLLSGNTASSGSVAHVALGGTIVYALPAPAGRWILRTGDANGADWAYLLANSGGSGAVSVQTLAQGSTNTDRCEPQHS